MFLLALDALQSWEESDLIFNICREALSWRDEGESPSFLACDSNVWKKFIAAASQSLDQERYVLPNTRKDGPRTPHAGASGAKQTC